MNNILDQQHDGYSKEITRDFFKNVYAFMFGALAISGIIAYTAGTPEVFVKYFLNAQQTGLSPLFYVVAFAPVGLGLLIQMAYQRLSLGVLLFLFLVYSVLMGLSLSSVMLAYSGQDIALTFFVTAGAFGGMAVLGYTTKTDLTKFGSLMYMAFIGIFIAGIANMFIESSGLSFWIAVIGVFVFTGLTAYYMQKLKSTAQDQSLSEIDRSKLALVGGLMLYILFVNLFLSLLRLMGGRD
ncbi:MAG: Bax inhibitor-1/YccA family protein [Crocinitomicaceae bacterium]|nr:Bax inhibitor-1/YccA family protein [Crocinitomicaceae bacterium]